MITHFDRFSLIMTREQALHASHPGDCTAEVKSLEMSTVISNQLNRIPTEDMREELREYGAWDEMELANDADNRARIVWIAAGNIREDMRG